MTLTFALGPWTFAWTSLLSLVITPEYFMMIPWWEHSVKGVADRRTDGRMDGQTEVFLELLGHIEMYSNVSDNCLSMSGNCQICFMNTGSHFPKKKIMHFLTRKLYIYKQGKSEGFESCDRPIVRKRPIWVKIGDVLSRVTLKFDGWPWKTIGHLSFAVWSFVQHFIAIGEFKLELLTGNAQFGSNSTIFRAVWPWNLTHDLEKQ